MKRILTLTILILLVVTLVACAQASPTPALATLKVTTPAGEKAYTAEALKALGSDQAAFKGVTYVGVPLTVLLKDAGADSSQVTAVKAVASDGFTVNYDSKLATQADTLVAYATANGPLAADDGTFRMVLPDEEGKLNPRQLVELQVLP